MKSRVTKPGRPIAAIRMSPRAATDGRSGVFEWQIVTVASRCKRSIAIGFPTISLRPMTTAWRPPIGTPERSRISITPAGVHGFRCARPCTSLPTFTGWKPSTSLSGSIASKTCCEPVLPIEPGRGACTRMPSCRSLAFKRSTSARSSASDAVAGNRCKSTHRPASLPALTLLRTYTSDAGLLPTSTIPSPGGRPARAVNACTAGTASARISAAIAVPSIILAGGFAPPLPPTRSLAGAPGPAPLAWLTSLRSFAFDIPAPRAPRPRRAPHALCAAASSSRRLSVRLSWRGASPRRSPLHARSRGPRAPRRSRGSRRFARSPSTSLHLAHLAHVAHLTHSARPPRARADCRCAYLGGGLRPAAPPYTLARGGPGPRAARVAHVASLVRLRHPCTSRASPTSRTSRTLRGRLELAQTVGAPQHDQIVAGAHGRFRRRIEIHLAVGAADADDDDAVLLTQARVDQAPSDQRRSLSEMDLFQGQVEVFRRRRELDEIDDGGSESRLRKLQPADMVRRDHAVGARACQLGSRVFSFRAADDEEVGLEQTRAEDGIDVLRIGADGRDEAPRVIDAHAPQHLLL